jgi:hypothetical protein
MLMNWPPARRENLARYIIRASLPARACLYRQKYLGWPLSISDSLRIGDWISRWQAGCKHLPPCLPVRAARRQVLSCNVLFAKCKM